MLGCGGNLGAVGSLVFVAILLGQILLLVFTALREVAHTQPSFKGPMGGGKMELSVMRGYTEEGAASSAWVMEGKEGFTDERSFAVGFEGQVRVSWRRTWETSR